MPEAGAPITHRRVLAIAVPIAASNVTVPLLGAVDTGVVGQIGEAAPIAAVGVGAILMTAVYWVFGFLRMGTTGLTSQALGAGQHDEAAALLTRAMMIAAAGGMAVIALQVPLFRAGFWISPASPQVEGLARDYMAIRVWSAPAAISVFGITGWLIAQERAGAVFAVQAAMNGMNILLDLWFVMGFGWGVTGVAWATFASEWAGLGFGLWLCRGAFAQSAWRDWARVLDAGRLRLMAAVNRDILLRSLMLEAIILSFVLTGGRFGDTALAANQVLLQFLHIAAFGLDGFAFAAEALVGQATGARDPARLRRGAVVATQCAAVVVALVTVAFALFGADLVDLLAKAPDVRAAAREFLPYAVAAPAVGVLAWMLDGIFIGATRGPDMRNMMAVSLCAYAAMAAALVPLMGNHGLWIALLLSLVVRAVTLGLRYPAVEAAAREMPKAA